MPATRDDDIDQEKLAERYEGLFDCDQWPCGAVSSQIVDSMERMAKIDR
jgi:hypothetical protein